MNELMSGLREAVAIWLVLLAVLATGFGLLTLTSRPNRPERPRGWTRPWRAVWVGDGTRAPEAAIERRPSVVEDEPRSSAADDMSRYAEEVTVAAERASVMAERRRAEWLAAQRTQEAAWRAYEEAEEAVRRLSRAEVFPTSLDPGDLEACQRYLHRAATDAYQRGEISCEQFADVLAHRNGWDPARHPFEQQMMLRRVARDRLLRAYREASEVERAAAQSAEIAAAGKRSLDDEAFGAALRARRAELMISGTTARRTLVPAG